MTGSQDLCNSLQMNYRRCKYRTHDTTRAHLIQILGYLITVENVQQATTGLPKIQLPKPALSTSSSVHPRPLWPVFYRDGHEAEFESKYVWPLLSNLLVSRSGVQLAHLETKVVTVSKIVWWSGDGSASEACRSTKPGNQPSPRREGRDCLYMRGVSSSSWKKYRDGADA